MSYNTLDDIIMKYVFILSVTIAILLITIIPPVAAISGSLKITNLSNTQYSISYEQLAEMPKTAIDADLYCYGSLLTSGNWAGVKLSYLMNQTGITSDVNSIEFLAGDNYAVSIPINLALAPETIIAYERDCQPLAEELRLVLPGCNGASWIAQIVSITMSNTEVLAPAPITVGGTMDRNLLSEFNRIGTAPLQSPIPQTPTPSTVSSPVYPTPTPTVSSPSETEVEPAPSQIAAANQKSSSLNLGSIGVMIAVIAAGLALVTLKYKRRTKQDQTQENAKTI